MAKRFALFDVDKTLYNGISLLDLVDEQVASGLVHTSVPDRLRQTMSDHEAGQIAYEDMAVQLLEIYAKAIKGKPYDEIFQSSLQFFRQSPKFFDFTRPVIELLAESHEITLVTAMPDACAKAVAAVVGATGFYASEFGLADGRFTGSIAVSLANRRDKHACIQRIEHEHSMQNSFVFGDSEGDIEMLRAASHAICISPSEGLRAEAKREGWHMAEPAEVLELVRSLH